jgi:hypothetical protein
MQTTIAALAVLAVGYLLSHLLFDRLRLRFGYVGAAEYVLLGILLGPATGVLSEDVVRDLTPLVSLALGWVGMTVGTYFRLPAMALLPGAHVRIAFTEACCTFTFAAVLAYGLLHYAAGYDFATAAVPALTLAAIAVIGAPSAVDALALRGFGTRPHFPVLQLAARIDALVGIAAFGLILAIFHQGATAPSIRAPTATEWAVINVVVGVVSGVLFHLFLGPKGELAGSEQQSRLFIALAGAIVIASGASYYLNLSPIFTSLVLGVILANTAGGERSATRVLRGTQRPIYLALLIFAGAAWRGGDVSLYFIPPAFIAIRLLARLAGGWVGGRLAAPPDAAVPGLGRGLLGQGPVGVAVAMNFAQVYPGVAAEAVLGAALLSVLVFEVVAHPEAASLLDPGGRAAEAARAAPELEPELTPLGGTPAVARPASPPDEGAP